MFSRTGVLEHCEGIALFFHVIASIIVLVSVGYMLYSAFKRKESAASAVTPLASIAQETQKQHESSDMNDNPDKHCWSVWRQDDNGNVSLVKSGLTKPEALSLITEYEAKGHKQTYWAQEDK